ncbi:hypothetical protein [Corynebacterium flavescens]|uniref:hypothetical protein n=1 Tax=Corynebacterium flavescens TaxID=28028 RepID=UPI00264735CF|nr:hypothetical protein [Corynebacterium flavescens]MDN6099791.1 hypothetical protein [Corynebacterium flavescens]MDN6237037.1 hypothetical protein [Corynebacterium flavescens]MDN6430085.1 hypothetical protein [Corynebacterium flavescens]MDN6474170.1 hypothetical protein [Corynebacterium flavescens]MDN6530529.1 hypothetical protein [Corynebacterium flavescens]
MTENASSDPEINDVADFDDPRRPLERALRFGWWALVAITIVSLAVWGGVKGLPGIWGVLIGASVAGAFVLFTALSVLFTSNTTPTTTLAVIMGSWLLKLVLLLVVLFIIRDLEFYDPMALFVTVVLALILTLGTETWGIITSRVSYVS